jgi:hypothetical protein
MVLFYIIPLATWLAFVYVQHHYGDRPTTVYWWALMSAIGTFEYGKCVYAHIEGLPSISLALATSLFVAGAVLVWAVIGRSRGEEPLRVEVSV